MKKNVWSVYMAVVIFTSIIICCSNETQQPELLNEPNRLSLIAPNKRAIATDLNALKQQTAEAVKIHYGEEMPFEITNVTYEHVDQGYLAWVEYKLSNGYTSKYIITTNMKVIGNMKADQLIIKSPLSKGKQLSEDTVAKFICEALPGCTSCQVCYDAMEYVAYCKSEDCEGNGCKLIVIMNKP